MFCKPFITKVYYQIYFIVVLYYKQRLPCDKSYMCKRSVFQM